MSSYTPLPVMPGESSTAAGPSTRPSRPDRSFLSRLLVVPDPFAPPVEWHDSRDEADDSSNSGIEEDEYDVNAGRGADAKRDVERAGTDEEEEDLGWTEGLLSGTKTKGTEARKARLVTPVLTLVQKLTLPPGPVQRRLALLALLPTSLILLSFLLFSTLSSSTRLSTSSLLKSDGPHTYVGEAGKKVMSLDELRNGTFWTEKVDIEWLAEAGDGVYSQKTSSGSILLTDLNANSSRILVEGDDVRDGRGRKLDWARFKLSADGKVVLFNTDWTKVWRHSTLSNFHLFPLTSSSPHALPLFPTSHPPKTYTAHFSPTSHHLAFVRENDLYVLPAEEWDEAERTGEGAVGERAVRVTRDASKVRMSGRPPWVYEEEIFSSDSTLYWSPSSSYLAFLSFDESDVPIYEYPVYNSNPNEVGGEEYPGKVEVPYPKAGYPNPLVTIHILSLTHYLSLPRSSSASSSLLTLTLPFTDLSPSDTVITEVAWVSEEEVLSQTIVPLLPPSSATSAPIPSYPPGYLDIVPSRSGYNHIAYFSPADAEEPVFLTDGEWEVDGAIERVDLQRGLVYFIGARPSTSRRLLTVPLPRSLLELESLRSSGTRPAEPNSLTEVNGEDGYHSVSVSPGGGVWLVNYEGPGLPWQKLFKADDPSFSLTLTDNAALSSLDAQYQHANLVYSNLSIPSGEKRRGEDETVEVNVVEIRPPRMDESGRTHYPVLFQVYGGPNSQMVNTRWQRDFQHYLSIQHNYIIVRIDPRGTGFRGRKFRTAVRGRLGQLEARDVIETARRWAARKYVDERRVGVWGWSYGGFLTSKIIEANSSVFSLGMAVAPVTDWRLYDSLYTERYMFTPAHNPVGYTNSSVHKMDGFKHAHFALAHGSGDDNVHFQQSALLLDRMTMAEVRDFRFRMFTDSDHSISTRNAYWELMRWLESFLVDKFGEGGRPKTRTQLGDREKE
ncbi:dipeptidyl aminopeptidase [Rhodotorula toruloides]|uniref:Dipeptidyl aminopeptidase n=1 Tax=Rhodotorula toruloides TaxID=5286 RepID=A0A511KBD5_RHOTO|nr:dipeptidyl aminopeptidase [Rhodotorula toruloides]